MVSLRFALNECAAMVWAFRDEWCEYFPTPNYLTSLYFAETEIGEAKDAWIRQHAGLAYNRSVQAKAITVSHELAQGLMMVITALGRDVDQTCRCTEPATISEILHLVSGAAVLAEAGHEWAWRLNAINAAYALVATLDNPVETMERVLDDLFEKRVEPRLAGK